MRTKFEIMRANRVARPAVAVLLLPIVPTMTIDGVEYEEATPTDGYCFGCAFYVNKAGCLGSGTFARGAFGGDCINHGVIYIKAA
jgi:hypothetical protein